MKIAFTAAVTAASLLVGAANAATLSGTFEVTVVNVLNQSSASSQATMANFDAALLASTDGVTSDVFTYTGDLDFGTSDGTDATTVAGWLASNPDGLSAVSGLDADVAALQLSKPNISSGSATTSFFLFDLVAPLGASDFTIGHDDGVAVFDDGVKIGGNKGPNAFKTTQVDGFDGGEFSLLYVATNGDPSILNVDATPIPLPAGLPLLAAGLGGLLALRRRRARS